MTTTTIPAPAKPVTIEDCTVTLANNTLNTAGNILVGKIDAWLSVRPSKLHNRSSIARGVKAGYRDVEIVLDYMVRNGVYVTSQGNGRWEKFCTTSPQV